jgi:hypothetical protein
LPLKLFEHFRRKFVGTTAAGRNSAMFKTFPAGKTGWILSQMPDKKLSPVSNQQEMPGL